MRPTGQEFLSQHRKAITLMGMSGVGKTYLATKLKGWGWDGYSSDYEIATKHLRVPVSEHDLTKMAEFIGKIGKPEKGGIELKEFKKRQQAYYKAECATVDNVGNVLVTAQRNFIHDSTGSLCEIEDEAITDRLGRETLMVYIQSDDAHNQKVLQRAKTHPKPLFFPPKKFDEWLAQYMSENGFSVTEQIEPDNFAMWVFPKLFEQRLPKYRKIADKHGVTIPVADLANVNSEEDFLDVVASALG